ncbi:MAG: DUF485 domain-containing protein [Actinomycetota bacterium]|nr:DUF485 domain-containing protein [Actinomycetota bacterium]
MTATDPTTGGRHEYADGYVAVAESADFAALRRIFRRFVFPMTALFLGWYFLYVLLSNYATGFMGKEVFGNVHVGTVFGLLQFVSTFAITIAYARWADRVFDDKAAELSERVSSHVATLDGTER